MTNTNKIIYLSISLIILLGIGYLLINKAPTDDVVLPPNSLAIAIKTFTASDGTFTFNYNQLFKVVTNNKPSLDWELNATQQGVLLATLSISKSDKYMPQTNFSDSKLTIGRSTDTSAIKNCLVDNSGMNVKGVDAIVGGYPFKKFIFSGVGAGNLYETTSYKGILDGDCYVVESTIHSTNIGNYPPESGIKEFDKTKAANDLALVVQSMRFMLASD